MKILNLPEDRISNMSIVLLENLIQRQTQVLILQGQGEIRPFEAKENSWKITKGLTG